MKIRNGLEFDEQKITLADVAKSYRRYAQVYDWLFGLVLKDGRKKLIEAVKKLSPHSILEMGVGTGLLLPYYPSAASVLGVDISAEMLALAKTRVEQCALSNVSLALEDCENLSCADASFDCVVLPYILSVTPSPRSLIDEAMRVCKPGGHIIIVNHFSGSNVWAFSERLVSALAARIGFRSAFSYDHVSSQNWVIQSEEPANLLGLSKVVVAWLPAAEDIEKT